LTGDFVWARKWGQIGSGSSVATDGNKIIVAGYMEDAGRLAGFLRIYSQDGNLSTEQIYGDPDYEDGFLDVCAQNGIAYCIGTTQSYSSGHSWDMCLVGYDITTGTVVLNLTWGGSEEEDGNGIAIIGNGDIYCAGGKTNSSTGNWEIFLLKYTNHYKVENISISFLVNDPSGASRFNMINETNTTGVSVVDFKLPDDAPEGIYNCSVAVNDSGILRYANSTFEVRWPWSPVLAVISSIGAGSSIQGEIIMFSAYAGYESPLTFSSRT
jgi:hypothetical protein